MKLVNSPMKLVNSQLGASVPQLIVKSCSVAAVAAVPVAVAVDVDVHVVDNGIRISTSTSIC